MLNNRLEDLIILYKNYRIKKLFKYTLQFILLVILIVGIFLIFNTFEKIKQTTKPISEKIDKNTKKSIDINKTEKIINKIKSQLKPKPKPLPKIDEEKEMKKNTFKALMLIEKQKPSYQSALDIAKYYFEHKNYDLSAKWAVIASNREPKHEDAWLLYAKSKIKLNQKGIAKKSLKIYLLKYHSQKIKNLLNSL